MMTLYNSKTKINQTNEGDEIETPPKSTVAIEDTLKPETEEQIKLVRKISVKIKSFWQI